MLNNEVSMNWYVVFVKTGQEADAVIDLRLRLDEEESFPFVPMKETLFKRSGVVRKEKEVLFPGYIFVETDEVDDICPRNLFDAVQKSRLCHRILNYGSYENSAMNEEEQELLCSLMDEDGLIESSDALLVGDRVMVISGALKGYENRIVSYDRHKRTAVIEVTMMNKSIPVTVALNTLVKLPENKTKYRNEINDYENI